MMGVCNCLGGVQHGCRPGMTVADAHGGKWGQQRKSQRWQLRMCRWQQPGLLRGLRSSAKQAFGIAAGGFTEATGIS